MPINEANKKRIDDLEKTLKEQLFWLARDAVNQTTSIIGDYKNLRQFTIGISVAVIGVVFPIMIANEIFKDNAHFIVSLICFSVVVIYGLCHLILSTMNDLVSIHPVIDSHLEKLQKCIEEVQEIKKIEDNNEAGKKYNALQEKYTKQFPPEKLWLVQKLWRKYEGLFFFGFFIVGYIFLIIGFFFK